MASTKRPSLTPKPRALVFTVEDRLNTILTHLLGGPERPDRHHMTAAAHAFLLLEEMGLKCVSTTARDILSGDNPHKVDFLERVKRSPV